MNKKIKIIKHEDPEPVQTYGDILYPFKDWDSTLTGDKWYSKFPEEFYEDKPYYPLTSICQNPWEALIKLNVNCFDFKEQVEYECPYNHYKHFWCVPVFIFSDNIKFWVDRHKTPTPEIYLDRGWMKNFFPAKTKNGLSFTKIQRALLGPGYTHGTMMCDGSGYLYDALLSLDNGDFVGVKVWMWFNK